MPAAAQFSERYVSKLDRIGDFAREEIITVLLIEDSRSVRAMLGNHIRQLENVRLLEAETLAGARGMLDDKNNDFFCAIVDLTLPDASGCSIIDAVSSYGVPIIVLAGSTIPEVQQAMQQRKIIDYMLKDSPAALAEVAYLVGRLRQNREMKVLVVDDSATFCHHLGCLLEQYRFPVIKARHGKEALGILEEHPDTALVITDYHMPEMDGLELIRRIRSTHRKESLSIIGLSDTSRQDLAIAMLKAGANDFLNKQFQPEEFYCRVVQNINMVGFVRQLSEMANRDYLTRLYNRRYLFEVGEVRHRKAREKNEMLAVAVVDADHFKRINDRFGHAAGDLVLRQLADSLRGTLSRTDVVSRYGGEEFVCITHVDAPEEGYRRFEALRRTVEALTLQAEGQAISVTISVGLTCRLGESLNEMIDRADEAVYRAKAEGRNRVVELS